MPTLARLARPALVLGAAIAVAACGGGGASAGAPTPVPSGVVFVEAKEYAYTPSTITIPAGPVTFSVKNAGAEEHEFEVFASDDMDSPIDEIEGLLPGLTLPLTLDLQPGSYTYICLLNGHNLLGMQGTLTVQ